MIFKVMSMRKDENGDFPVYSSFIEECYRIDWREEKLNNGKHYLLFIFIILSVFICVKRLKMICFF